MHAARGRRLRYALVACAAMLAGCRGESREREEREAERRATPADEKLAWPVLDEPGLLAAVATEGFELGVPVPLAILPDGAVLFRRSKARDPVADLYQLDPAGATTALATAAGRLGAAAGGAQTAAARGIETIEVSQDGGRVLVPLAGRLFVIARATGAVRELAIGAHRDPRLSPDGKRVAFVRDGDLWIAPVDEPDARPAAGGATAARRPSAPPVRLTRHPPDREYATPETVAREFGRAHGYWWSPDGESLAFQRTDARAVDTLYLGDPRRPDQPPAAVKVPRSGKTNATVDLGIVSARRAG
jgi:dipeptidyl-peptidase 4